MCGIIAYIGKRQAVPLLVEGLSVLEYRGYDSAGVAVLSRDGKISSEKAVGHVMELAKALKKKKISGTLGIAHTRWATHGKVTKQNTHPHRDCSGDIWVVHSGIIENYLDLKNSLKKRGHRFISETDTEVISHLIEEVQKKNPSLALEDTVAQVMKKVRGTYGIVVISAKENGKLVAMRNFSPLVLGVGKNEYFVASDVLPILKHTKRVLYLNDGEMLVLSRVGYKIFNSNHRRIKRMTKDISIATETSSKGNYPHFMLKEICKQPDSIFYATNGRVLVKEGNAKLGGLETVLPRLKKIKRIIITACGTAYFAAAIGRHMLEEYAGVSVEVELASELRYRNITYTKNDMLLVISQSGETADTLAALREAKKHGVLTIGIINTVGSTIAREVDAGISACAGPEISVASTKAFTSQVVTLALFTLAIGRERTMSQSTGRTIAKEIKKLPKLIEVVIMKEKNHIRRLVKKYQSFNNFLFLGRKYNYPTACEGALKLKEVSYVHAEGCAAGEVKHGPLAMIDKTFPCIFLAPSDSLYEKVVSNIQEVKARNGPIIAIATEGNKKIKELADDVIYIPKIHEMLIPILSVVPLQLFAYYYGVARGRDVDKPRNLAKSVTVE